MILKYRYQLLSYFLLIILVVVAAAVVLATQHTRDSNVTVVKERLGTYNDNIYEEYLRSGRFENIVLPDHIRFTVLDTNYRVIYDNRLRVDTNATYPRRQEILQAKKKGEGSSLRLSRKTNVETLYYARKYRNVYITTSTPFEIEGVIMTSGQKDYIYILIGLVAFLFGSIIVITNTILKPLKSFREFISVLKSGEKDFSKIKFTNDEYGQVGKMLADTLDELEDAKRYKQELSHNISHELKTPVTGIRGYLETILSDKDIDKELMLKFVDKAYLQTLRLVSLINDVSIINKMDEGAKYYKTERINIYKCLLDVREELGYKLKEHNIKFEQLISTELTITGCYQLIYSLFKNLVDNTIEHGGDNTTITINAGVENKGEYAPYGIKFTYSDTGKGVPDEALAKLFERFYRIESGRVRTMGGSGLGLAIVKNAVLFHKGKIEVMNREGGGLVFKFTLMSME